MRDMPPVPASPIGARSEHARAVDRWAATRSSYLDNLKILVVASVIFMHGCVGYVAAADQGWWPYANVQETQLTSLATAVLFALAGPVALFMMALLFLVSGLLTRPSVDRKGPGRFAVDRLVRLGIPYAAVTLVLWPLLLYLLYRPLGLAPGSFWTEYAHHFPDSGPLWFVGALLIFSLGYAGWRSVRPSRRIRPGTSPLGVPSLLRLALAIAVTTYVIRLRFPYGSQTPLYLNEWQWPECAGLFAVGISASREGWADRVPARLAGQSRNLMVAAVSGALVLAVFVGVFGVDVEQFVGGWRWPAAALAIVEGVLTVFGSIWLLAMAQRYLDRRFRMGPALARCGYGAFVVQGFVLIGLALLLRPVPLPAEVKALTVATLGVAGSFGLVWLLVTRIPALARLL